jgi:uncharacterized protein (TIGR03067 family)
MPGSGLPLDPAGHRPPSDNGRLAIAPGPLSLAVRTIKVANRMTGPPAPFFRGKERSTMKAAMTVSLTFAVVLLATGQGPKAQADFDPGNVVGDWTFEQGKWAGQALPRDQPCGKVTFTKDTITAPGEQGERIVIAYKIDATMMPATIDTGITRGPLKGTKAFGIIKLEDDKLTICYATSKDERPTDFDSKKNKAICLVLKRVKRAK